jgi:hypothetical protein
MAVPESVVRGDLFRVFHGCAADEWLISVKMLRQFIDGRERDAVRRARAEGRTWGEIGRCLGISRQAARQRFAELPPVDPESAQERYYREFEEREALVMRTTSRASGLPSVVADGRLDG